MEIVTCIEKIRDHHGVIKEYILNSEKNGLIKIEPSELKWNIQHGHFLVDNLKLTTNNRLVDIKIDAKKSYITRDIIQTLNSETALSFKSGVNLNSILKKASMIGTNIIRLNRNTYALITKNSRIIVSNKQLAFHMDSSSLFSNTIFSSIDFKEIDTSDVVNASYMFNNCKTISLNLSNFNTKNIKNMENMFSYCNVNELDISNFSTSNVKNMEYMFFNCKTPLIDISNFNTSSLKNTNSMFRECKAIVIKLGTFSAYNVQNSENMFTECKSNIIR